MSRSVLARDLAQNYVVAQWRRNYQRRPPLGPAEIGEWEAQDYDIALYKPAQAESSSGLSQSFAKEVSAASTGVAASKFISLMARMKARSLSRSRSGSRSSSRAMSSRFPIPIWYGSSMVPASLYAIPRRFDPLQPFHKGVPTLSD